MSEQQDCSTTATSPTREQLRAALAQLQLSCIVLRARVTRLQIAHARVEAEAREFSEAAYEMIRQRRNEW